MCQASSPANLRIWYHYKHIQNIIIHLSNEEMEVQKVKQLTSVESLPGLKELRCIKYYIISDNPENWREVTMSTLSIVFDHIYDLINKGCRKNI